VDVLGRGASEESRSWRREGIDHVAAATSRGGTMTVSRGRAVRSCFELGFESVVTA
jgi:hypothetical protein